MGWELIPWYTLTDDFDVDFGVEEWHGTNAFLREGDRIFRTYFIDARGDEAMGSTWAYLDITALGRQEAWEDSPEGYPQTEPYGWWRLHDEYGEAVGTRALAGAGSAEGATARHGLVIAHIGGLPLEEALPSLASAGAGLVLVRTWLRVRLRAAGSGTSSPTLRSAVRRCAGPATVASGRRRRVMILGSSSEDWGRCSVVIVGRSWSTYVSTRTTPGRWRGPRRRSRQHATIRLRASPWSSVTYHGPTGHAPHHLPFRRAALSFMHWQVRRGVLDPLDVSPPGSLWWRAMNERLLRDGCEAVALVGGLSGPPSSRAVRLWLEFVEGPTARTWYRAHNASIVAGYLEHERLADAESRAGAVLHERRAHPRPVRARPRRGAASGAGRVRPARPRARRSPARHGGRVPVAPARAPGPVSARGRRRVVHRRRAASRPAARLRGHRAPAATPVRVVAEELCEPRLLELVRDGSPIYCWPLEDRHVWSPPHMPLAGRVLERVTRAR